MKIKASKAAPKKKSSQLAASFDTHVYLSDILNEIKEPVKEKLRRIMGNSHSRNLPQRTTYTCDTHEPHVRSHEDARGRVDQET